MTDAEAKELHNRRNDPDEWANEPEGVRVRPTTTTEVVSFRLSSEELDQLQAAAQDRNESLSQFIRDSIRMRLQGTELTMVEDFTSAVKTVLFVARPRGFGSRVSPSCVPDFPPTSQNLTSSEGVRSEKRDPQLPLEV